MHEGATLGRRFTTLRAEPHDVPGVDRWVALDARRDVEVTVDILTSLAPGAVRQAAVRAAQVRDARFARVLASGRENVGSDRVTYVVTERPHGVRASDLIHERVVPPRVAGAIVGEAARALQVAAGQGIHHGFLRARAITVADGGRVVVSGLDAEGELATQAGLGRGRTEQADAAALAHLYLALVTGMESEQVTVPDLPDALSLGAANLARAAIAGTGPDTLAQVAAAMGPPDPAALRGLRGSLPSLPAVAHEEPQEPHAPIAVSPETLAAAEHQTELSIAAAVAAPGVAAEVAAERIVAPELEPGAAVDRSLYASPEEAAQFSRRTRKAVERERDQPLALDTFEEINEEQNAGDDRSVVQATLEFAQRHLPRNAPLDAAVERAQDRAGRSGPLSTGPLLVGLFATALLIVGLVAFNMLVSPVPMDGLSTREPDYPAYTFSPAPLPSASPSATNTE
ncbi:hypothetical protein [Demequina activiva]|uniref:Protein kinase domain-containing protein n=1 Tax=Demequina activiva TaxID=1582364 RepID=A0A919Q391_9MICO|nr:hypothetical protein [Demequina activiva]GIG54081.1 hypothetical protein Dac01nite_08330 [Demequina activiva]